MTTHYNKPGARDRRRQLRRDQTYCEKIVWMHLRDRRLLGLKFRRQYSIDQFIIDFYSPKLKLAVEIDGDVHDLPDQKDRDGARQEYLETFGITFVRIKNEELLANPNMAFEKIAKRIKELEKNIAQQDQNHEREI